MRKFAAVVALLIAVSWCLAPGTRAADSQALFEEGMKALEAGNFEEARGKLQQVLEIEKKLQNDRNIAPILAVLGDAYRGLGQPEKALEHYNQALTILSKTKKDKESLVFNVEAETLMHLGELYVELSQYEKAGGSFQKAVKIFRELKDPHREIEALKQLALAQRESGSFQQALTHFQQALQLARKLKDRQEEGWICLLIGMSFEDLHQYEKALDYCQNALSIAQERKNRQGEGIASYYLGKAYLELWQLEKAQKHLQHAVAIFREAKDQKMEVEVLEYLGLSKVKFKPEEALGHFQEVLKLARTTKDQQLEARILLMIAMFHEFAGRHEQFLRFYRQGQEVFQQLVQGLLDRQKQDEALAIIITLANLYSNKDILIMWRKPEVALGYFQQGLALARAIKDRRREGQILNEIGLIYGNFDQHQQALEYLRMALKIAQDLKDQELQGAILNNLGAEAFYSQQVEQARDYHLQALKIWQKLQDYHGISKSSINLSGVYNALGDRAEALKYAMKSLELTRKLKEHSDEAVTLVNIGMIMERSGQYKEAKGYLTQALDISRQWMEPEKLWLPYRNMGDIETKLGNYQAALSYYEKSLELIESTRAGLSAKEAQSAYGVDKHYTYDELIDLLYLLHQKNPSQDYAGKALEVFEKRQGRIFLEEMGKTEARNFSGLPEEVRAKETQLEEQLASLQTQVEKKRGKPQEQQDGQILQNLQSQIDRGQTELQILREEIAARYPDYYALKYPKPAGLKDLQGKVLQPQEILLIYEVGEKTTILWLVSPREFAFLTLNIGEKDLHKKISSFRQEVLRTGEKVRGTPVYQARPETPGQKVGRELYQLLLPEKVRQSLAPGQLLYIVPTGPLYALPFEALETQGPEQPRRYLIQDHPVAYLSSASLLKVLREAQGRKKEEAAHPFLAFAHPVYPREPAREKSDLESRRHRAYRDQAGGEFSELPETADEVKEIQKILKAPEASQPLNLREQAARSRVLALHQEKKLTGYRYVVFACHGLLPGEATRLVQPALALSYPEQDGFLTMGEVFGLKFNARLVTLSACNTGQGTPLKGEGIMGLTRAFMYAGTPAVGVTLWSVESNSAKDLDVGLHRYLSQGLGRAEALRRIKLDMLQGEKEFGEKDYRHPHFWAPLVVFGDGQ